MTPFIKEIFKAAAIIKRSNSKIFKCQCCGIEFAPKTPNHSTTHCSVSCSKKNKFYEYECSHCKKIFVRSLVSKSINKFCTPECKCKFTYLAAKAKKPKRPKWR